jgi:branched-chain amino acid transport system ATP-binding protein
MVAIARGLMARPKLLMIDEPFLGLAPRIVEELTAAIRRINAEGVTIVLIEQNVQLALSIATRGYILESGHSASHG